METQHPTVKREYLNRRDFINSSILHVGAVKDKSAAAKPSLWCGRRRKLR
jgi:hypothetical protein